MYLLYEFKSYQEGIFLIDTHKSIGLIYVLTQYTINNQY